GGAAHPKKHSRFKLGASGGDARNGAEIYLEASRRLFLNHPPDAFHVPERIPDHLSSGEGEAAQKPVPGGDERFFKDLLSHRQDRKKPMSLSLITAENLRDPLRGILDTLVERHIAHRLVDDFLILTPDEVSASDVESALLSDPRLGGVLTGESVLPLPAWISSLVREMEPRVLSAPAWALQALFASLAKKSSALALGERISVSSLSPFVRSFREELRGLDSLRAFVQDLDPDFADEAVRLAREYADRIDALPSCKDFAWRASRVLEGVEKGGIPTLKKI